jgi:gamma-glutamyltranspeptidase / glutathione hydrolase
MNLFFKKVSVNVRKLLRYFVIGALFTTLLVVADMILYQNVYHPLTYPYALGHFLTCRFSPISDCPVSKNLSAISRQTIGENGGVATSHHAATQVGIDILKAGGTAVDAAVAVGYALSVVDPCCGNLGGGGFMVIHTAKGENTFINFREWAPQAATAGMFLDNHGQIKPGLSTQGYLAAAVPGTVKGLDLVLSRYGTMPRLKVMQGAIRLAEKGFKLTDGDVRILRQGIGKFRSDPSARRIFMPKNHLLNSGDILIQKDLAKILKLIARKGDSAFYQGSIAHEIVKANQANQGLITLPDLANYQVIESQPLRCRYRDVDILTTPLPGGGTTVCQMLSILEGYPLRTWGHDSPETIHKKLSAMLLAYADRNRWLGDPRFVNTPQFILSDDYISKLRQHIGKKALNPNQFYQGGRKPEGQNTTHYSVIDQFGNAVSVTYTINSLFGAGVVPGRTGFFLNNEMDDFTSKVNAPNQFGLVQGELNQIEPGKQPLSSMSPTILLKGGNVVLVTGSPGGSTIPTTVMQVISNFVDHQMSFIESVNLPKIHYQGQPNIVAAENQALTNHAFLALWGKGYRVLPFIPWGAAESVGRHGKNIYGIPDLRRPGGSALSY